MTVLVQSFGTAGDNEPFLAIGRALAELGHEPVMLLNPAREEGARRAGLAFRPVGPRWHHDEVQQLERYLHPTKGGIAIWREICLPQLPHAFRATEAAIREERADVALCHFLCLGGQWATRRAGIPGGGPAAERDEARLVRVQFQSELREPLAKLGEEALGVLPMLEPHDEVVGEAHDDDIVARLLLLMLVHASCMNREHAA